MFRRYHRARGFLLRRLFPLRCARVAANNRECKRKRPISWMEDHVEKRQSIAGSWITRSIALASIDFVISGSLRSSKSKSPRSSLISLLENAFSQRERERERERRNPLSRRRTSLLVKKGESRFVSSDGNRDGFTGIIISVLFSSFHRVSLLRKRGTRLFLVRRSRPSSGSPRRPFRFQRGCETESR